MEKIKKLLLALSFVVLLLVSVACSTNPLSKYEKLLKKNKNVITINVWTYYNNNQKSAFDEIVSSFNSTVGKDKNISIKHQSFSSTTVLAEELLKSAQGQAAAADFPNIFQSYADDLMNLDFSYKNIAALDNYFTKDEINNFLDGVIDEGRYDANNSIKLIPFAKSAEILMINKTDFDAFLETDNGKDFSVSDFETYEKLLVMANKYKEETGKALYGRDAMANVIYLSAQSLNKPLFNINKDNYQATVTFDKSYFEKLYNYHYLPLVNGYFYTDINNQFHTDAIQTGKVISCVGSTAGVSYFPSSVLVTDTTSYPIEGMVSAPTIFEGGEKYIMSQGAGLAVSKSDELTEYASAIFLKYLTSSENNVKLAVKLGCYLPVTKDSIKYSLIEEKFIEIEKEKNNTLSKDDILSNQKNRIILATYAQLIDILKTHKSFSPKPFINSYLVRSIINSSIEGKKVNGMENLINAHDLIALIEEDIKNGVEKEVAINNHLEGNFETWFTTLESIVKEAVKVK